MSSDSLRFVITMLPLISLLILLRFGQYEKRILTSTFLSLLWNFSTLYIINMVAVSLGWWSFSTTDPLWLGLPPDVIFGWAIYWGPLFYLIGKRIPIFFSKCDRAVARSHFHATIRTINPVRRKLDYW